jgi:hypothetical protein
MAKMNKQEFKEYSEKLMQQEDERIDKEMEEAGHKGLEKQGKKAYLEVKARSRYLNIFNRYGIILGTYAAFSFILNIVILVFFMNQNVPPRFIPVDSQMRYFSPIALNKHNKTDSDIRSFVMTKLGDIYAYDYINWKQQLDKNQIYFTSDGWLSFIESMQKSFTVQTIVDHKMISSYRTTELPKVVQSGIGDNGKAFWWVETYGILTSTGSDKTINRNVRIRMKIERVSTLESSEGIGIAMLLLKDLSK